MLSSIAAQATTVRQSINVPDALKTIRYIVAAAIGIAPIVSTIKPDTGCKPN